MKNCPFNPTTSEHSTFTLLMPSRQRCQKWRKNNSIQHSTKHPTMKQLQFSEDEFSSSEDDSITPRPSKKTKSADNCVPRKTNSVKGAKTFPSLVEMLPSYRLFRSDLTWNYCAYASALAQEVTMTDPHVAGDRENVPLHQQLEVKQHEVLLLKQHA